MRNITFITPEYAENGFRLTGVDHVTVKAENAEGTILSMLDQPGDGLVVAEESLVKNIPEERLRDAERTSEKVLLILPAPGRPEGETGDYVARLIKRAIGYHVVLRI